MTPVTQSAITERRRQMRPRPVEPPWTLTEQLGIDATIARAEEMAARLIQARRGMEVSREAVA